MSQSTRAGHAFQRFSPSNVRGDVLSHCHNQHDQVGGEDSACLQVDEPKASQFMFPCNHGDEYVIRPVGCLNGACTVQKASMATLEFVYEHKYGRRMALCARPASKAVMQAASMTSAVIGAAIGTAIGASVGASVASAAGIGFVHRMVPSNDALWGLTGGGGAASTGGTSSAGGGGNIIGMVQSVCDI